MARVSRETAAAHRTALAETAGRLFREKGVDGVGVAEISKAAGLTHGALYSGFASKSELAVEALKAGAQASRARARKALGEAPGAQAILNRYMSRQQRDDLVNCCPLLASASEGARQGSAYREAFTEIFLERVESMKAALLRQDPGADPERARALVAAMIGVVAVARALEGKASEQLLAAARRHLVDLVTVAPAAASPREQAPGAAKRR